MNEEENPQRDSKPQPQAQPETTPTEPNASMPSTDAGWAGASPTQVMRTVAVALLTAAVVLGAFFLLWQVRTFGGWFVIALFLAAVLNPAVNWLQRRHRLMKRPPSHRPHLPGSIGGAAIGGGDLRARAGRPDKRLHQVRQHRGQRPRGSDSIHQGARQG